MVKIEVHVRSGCTCQFFFSVFFLGVSIDALDGISFRDFVRVLLFRHCFLLFYGCMDVGFNFGFVDWASNFLALS